MSTFKQNIIKTSYKKKKTFIYINYIHTYIFNKNTVYIYRINISRAKISFI